VESARERKSRLLCRSPSTHNLRAATATAGAPFRFDARSPHKFIATAAFCIGGDTRNEFAQEATPAERDGGLRRGGD